MAKSPANTLPVKLYSPAVLRGGPRGKSVFSGRIICAYCGAPMVHTVNRAEAKSGSISRYGYLRCRNDKVGACPSPQCPEFLPELALVDLLEQRCELSIFFPYSPIKLELWRLEVEARRHNKSATAESTLTRAYSRQKKAAAWVTYETVQALITELKSCKDLVRVEQLRQSIIETCLPFINFIRIETVQVDYETAMATDNSPSPKRRRFASYVEFWCNTDSVIASKYDTVSQKFTARTHQLVAPESSPEKDACGLSDDEFAPLQNEDRIGRLQHWKRLKDQSTTKTIRRLQAARKRARERLSRLKRQSQPASKWDVELLTNTYLELCQLSELLEKARRGQAARKAERIESSGGSRAKIKKDLMEFLMKDKETRKKWAAGHAQLLRTFIADLKRVQPLPAHQTSSETISQAMSKAQKQLDAAVEQAEKRVYHKE